MTRLTTHPPAQTVQPSLPHVRRAYGYCRVSTDTQRDNGVSLDEQEHRIRRRALEGGWHLTEIFIDAGISGSVPLEQRPEGARMLAAVTSSDAIVCPKLDRMFRSAFDALTVIKDLQKRRISLFLLDLGGDDVSSGIVSRMILTMLSVFAEFERERIPERIRDSKRQLRQEGRHQGGAAPFGWRVIKSGKSAGKLVPIPAEQEALRELYRLREEGQSLRAIAAALQERGHRISHTSVQRVLRRSCEPIAAGSAKALEPQTWLGPRE